MSKIEAQVLFESFFGDKLDIYLNRLGLDEKHWSGEEKAIKKKDIVNPSPSLYITVRKVLFNYKETGNHLTSPARWNCFLTLRAIMELNINDIKYSDWLGKYRILNLLDNAVLNR